MKKKQSKKNDIYISMFLILISFGIRHIKADLLMMKTDSTISLWVMDYGQKSKSVLELIRPLGFNKDWEENFSGKGMTIAIIDSGAFPHEDIKQRIIHFEDLINGEDECYDDYGHGTEVAGIIAGNGQKSGGVYKGVAPQANLVIIKAFDKYGNSDITIIEEGIIWVIENKEKFNIKILCMSLTYGVFNDYTQDPLYKKIKELNELGVLIVAAAGNTGIASNQITSPGNIREVLAVGSLEFAIDNNGKISYKPALFSPTLIKGVADIDKPDVFAPGTNIITTNSKSTVLRKSEKDYISVSGTSYSAAIVAGQAALIFEKSKIIDSNELINYIKATATEKTIRFK